MADDYPTSIERFGDSSPITPEFDDLAQEVGLKSHKEGATDPVERARLRAELDGMIAHMSLAARSTTN